MKKVRIVYLVQIVEVSLAIYLNGTTIAPATRSKIIT